MNRRREFLTQVGAFAALTSFDASELKAAAAPAAGAWDTSWIEALVPATYRVVFNAEDIAERSTGLRRNLPRSFPSSPWHCRCADASRDRIPPAGHADGA